MAAGRSGRGGGGGGARPPPAAARRNHHQPSSSSSKTGMGAPLAAAAASSPPHKQRRRAPRPRRLLPLFLLPLLVLLALCGGGGRRCPREASASPSSDALAAIIPALATTEGALYLSALPPATTASLAAGVEAMTPERKRSLASMSLDAVRRVFEAATRSAEAAEAAAAAAAPAARMQGRAAALAALAAKGLNNDDGLLDEPSLKTLRALATLPAERLRELATLGAAGGGARSAALGFFADGVDACSSARGLPPL